ncbi:MAG: Outer membrane protein assembly factor BamB [Alphaproteobacteria bacterium MarineAlpha5_Bin9]|nr:MAG: Outer membrane protein assembly factor BamB [Alphaproteobacteria bacterium MarineAlpha5_Bin9]|tara:strand:+ start:39616 stop:40881 length:1266 start_codon:yes stop_codon:yes gene_type:complete
MNLININKYLILAFFFTFLFSCSNSEKNEMVQYNDKNNEVYEQNDFIHNDIINQEDPLIKDYYNRNDYYKWSFSSNFDQVFKFSIGNDEKLFAKSSSILIDNNSLLFINKKGQLNIIDLINLESKNKYQIIEKVNNELFPAFISKDKNHYFIALGNGTIIKFTKDLKLIWKKELNQILRTPIKIYENKLIIIFNTNKIMSINTENGDIEWEYKYELDKPSLSTGGDLQVYKNFIFFKLPNGITTSVDMIMGEQNELNFLSEINQNNLLSYNYQSTIHIYDNIFVILEDNKNLYSYDLDNQKFLIFNEQFKNIKSFLFKNNSLFVIDNSNILKVYNIKNNNIFWTIDLNQIDLEKNHITYVSVNDQFLHMILNDGTLLNIDKTNGSILDKLNLKINNLDSITFNKDFYIFSQKNSKNLIFKK